jgi:hypothetical protein
MMDGIQRTEKEARHYASEMEKLHKEKWLPFRLPEHSRARSFGNFACCRESERTEYEAEGAVFI